MPEQDALLTISERNLSVTLPIHKGTLGPDVIEVSPLTQHGVFTYDSGFVSTAACESAITYIDGAQGILLHSGYPIDQLAEQSSFIETSYLLLHNELPKTTELSAFTQALEQLATIPDHLAAGLAGYQTTAHPMAILGGLMNVLAATYHDSININNAQDRQRTTYQLVAQIPILSALCYRHRENLPAIKSRADLPYATNFLNMMFAPDNSADYKVSPVLAQAMDRIFILHADHEQNASTSTVRLAGSSGANPFACIAAGIATLWGPAHGGANEAVLRMLTEIGDASKVKQYIERAKDKNDPFRLMGFGHRVYKNFDPRAKVMRKTCHEVLAELGCEQDPLFKLASELEAIALEDPYFIEKKLYPNVDFYSGIILKAIGIPVEMFTVIFALARTVGWAAHWNEMLSGGYRLGRPRQLYVGPTQRDYVTIDRRS